MTTETKDGFMADVKCECIIVHPAVGSNEWSELFTVWREVADHGNGHELAVISQQLFGICWTRAEHEKKGK